VATESEPAGFDRCANLAGALALAMVDRVSGAVAAATGQSETPAAALSALFFFIERPTIDMLRQVLGVTSSGAVRMVDRLEQLGYVKRRPGDDARSTFVVLTPAGRRVAERVARARAGELTKALSVLTTEERATFETLLGRVLAGMIRAPGAVKWTCRLCDTDVCGRFEGGCPVGIAAEERYGQHSA
jgi:DNA-binding MarR family transcriptional regulator